MLQTVFLTLPLIFSVTNEVYSNNCEVQQDCPSISADQDETSLIFLPIPSDCSKFIQCDRGNPYIVNCPSGLHFNRILNVCDWPVSANCKPCDNIVPNVEHRELSFKNNAEVSSSVCDNADAYTYLFPFPSDCAKFISCSNGIPYEMLCPDGLHFNNELRVCDFPTFAKCNIVTKTTATVSTTSSTTTVLGDESSTSADFCAQATAQKYLFPFPTDCTQFISCSNGVPYTMHCPAGLHFNSRINACDYVSSARCTISTNSAIIITTEAPIFTSEVVTSTSEIETVATEAGTTLEFVEDTTTPEEIDVMTTYVLGEPESPCPVDSFSHNVLLPVTNVCDKFISCENGVPLVINCPKGLHFSVEINLCDWPHLANCAVGTVAPTTATYDVKAFELTSTTTGSGIEDSISSDTPASEKTTIGIGTETETTTSIASATTKMTTIDGSTTDELTTLSESLVDHTTTVIASIIEDGIEVSTTTSNASAIPEVSKTEETTTEYVSQAQPVTTRQITVSSINDTITIDDSIIDDVTDVLTTSDLSITLELTTTTDEATNNSSTQTIMSESATETNTRSTADTNFTTTPDPEVSKSICPMESFSHLVLLPVKGDCGKFILCKNGAPHLMDCPRGLHFNIEISLCDWPHLTNCTVVTTTAAPTTTIDVITSDELRTTSSAFITTEPNTTIEVETEPETTSITANDKTPDELTLTRTTATGGVTEDTSTFADSSIADVTQVSTTTVVTSTGSQTATTSDADVSKSICPVESFSHHVMLPVKGDCGKFILCENGVPYLIDCPIGLHFNIEISLCDWPHSANCSLVTTTATPITTIDGTTWEELTTSTSANETATDGLTSTTVRTTDSDIEDTSTFVDSSITFDTPTEPQRSTADEETTAEETTIKHDSHPKTTNQITDSSRNVTTTSDSELSKSICPLESFSHHVLLPVAGDCGKFILCENGAPYLMDCPTGLHFNIEIKLCDWPHLANCSLVITTLGLPTTEVVKFPCPAASFAHFVLLPVANDCGKFISCQNGVAHKMSCPKGLHFNVEANYCDWPYLANCTLYENIIKVVTDITTTLAPGELDFPCPTDSFSQYALLPVAGDCGKFISCENGVPHEMNCPSGLHFNVEYKLCDWPHLANCTTVATTVAAQSTSTDGTTMGGTTTEVVPTSELFTITSENVTEPSSTTFEDTTTTSYAVTEPATTPNEEVTIITEEATTIAATVTTTAEIQTTTKQVAIDSSTTPSVPKLTTVEDTTKMINEEAVTTTDEVSTTTTVTETTTTEQSGKSSWTTTTALPASLLVITNSSTATSDSKPTSVEDTTTEIVTSTTSTDVSDKLTATITFAATTTEKVQSATTVQSNVSSCGTTTITDTTIMTTSEAALEHAIKTNEERIITSEEVSTTASAVTASIEVPTTSTQAAIDSSTSPSEPESTTTEATTTEVVYETSTTTTEGLNTLTTTDAPIDETTTFPSTRSVEVSTTTSTTEEITTTQTAIDSSTATEAERTRLEDTITDSAELTTTTGDNTTATTVTVTTTKQIGESSWKTTTVPPLIPTSEIITNPAIVKITTIREEITTTVPNEESKINNEPTDAEPEPTTVKYKIYTTHIPSEPDTTANSELTTESYITTIHTTPPTLPK